MKMTPHAKALAERERNRHALFPYISMPHAGPIGNSDLYKIEEKPMSDTLIYGSEKENRTIEKQEQYCSLGSRATKREQITKWLEQIADFSAQIKEIKADSLLTEDEKQKKINRRIELIKTRKQNIEAAQMYLQRTL